MDITRRHWMAMASTLVVGGTAAWAAPLPKPSIDLKSRGSRDPGPLLAALADCAQTEIQAFGLPGMSIGITGPDNLRATVVVGFADIETGQPVRSDHLFQIGSISKSLVALCVCQLADRGKFGLDQSVASLLPDIPLPASAMTVAMLLNHSAGLSADSLPFPRSPDGRLWTNYAPGTRFSYSNTGFNLLGMIVTRASRLPFHKAMQSYVFDPLGMTGARAVILTRDRAMFATGYYPFDDRGYLPGDALAQGAWLDIDAPAGSIAATPEDMARYAAYLARLGQGDGAPLLSKSMARRYCQPTIAAPQFGRGGRYAMGIASIDIDGRQCLHHTGGMINFRSSITVDPQAGGVFASSNAGVGGYRPSRISDHGCRLLRALEEGKPLPAAPELVPLPVIDDAELFAGYFLAEGGEGIAISAERGQMTVAARGQSGRLLSLGEGRFKTNHPQLAGHEIYFPPGEPVRGLLWWGDTRYGRNRAVPTPSPTPAIAQLAGRYVNDSPWQGSLSVIARGDQLLIENIGALRRADDGSWRIAGDKGSAERFWFEAFNDGRPQRLSFSGTDFVRFHDEEA